MTIDDALIFAAQKHRGQTDKSGQPYIFHPIRVMQNLAKSNDELAKSDEAKIAALLHDVVEDCDVSFDDLRQEGFSEIVVVAVDHLTKTPEGERNYQIAIDRAAQNPIARLVKIADLTDNLDGSRLPTPSEKDRERFQKYRTARAFLLALND